MHCGVRMVTPAAPRRRRRAVGGASPVGTEEVTAVLLLLLLLMERAQDVDPSIDAYRRCVNGSTIQQPKFPFACPSITCAPQQPEKPPTPTSHLPVLRISPLMVIY